MDPYLESHWQDVHTALIGYIRDALQPQLSGDLVARMEEHVYVEDDSEKSMRRPDVHVIESGPAWLPEQGQTSTAVLDEPVLLQPIVDPPHRRSVVIYDLAGKCVVTAIEILSPRNKYPGKPLRDYLQNRDRYVHSDMNLVEIDLIRTGDWTKMVGLNYILNHLRTAYRVTVEQPDAGSYLYAIALNARLPTIKVPLRPQDTSAKTEFAGAARQGLSDGAL